MNPLLQFLSGKKTYLVCALAGILLFGDWQKWWTMPPEIYAGLTALAIAFLRAGVAKIQPADPGQAQPVAVSMAGGKAPLFLFAIAISLALHLGCTTSQQRVTFNTLYSIEQGTTSALDGYDSLVIQGKISTNDVPKVSAAYNKFQTAFLVALDAARYNTNAIAPPSLVVESEDVVNLINSLKGSK